MKRQNDYITPHIVQWRNCYKNSDFVCVMVPLSKHTEKLIGRREFSLMKNSGI
ncbi:NAD(P)-dependent oxidoreductase [Ureibacillus acetophenoni]